MARYCDDCEEYTEVDAGRCVVCNNLIEKEKKEMELDGWEENDPEWGTEDEAEELEEEWEEGD